MLINHHPQTEEVLRQGDMFLHVAVLCLPLLQANCIILLHKSYTHLDTHQTILYNFNFVCYPEDIGFALIIILSLIAFKKDKIPSKLL